MVDMQVTSAGGATKKRYDCEGQKKIKHCEHEVILREHLGEGVYMEILVKDCDFHEEYIIDLRRWEQQVDGRLIATQEGVRLPIQRFVHLLWYREDVQELLHRVEIGVRVNKKLFVGHRLFLHICFPSLTVHLREYRTEAGVIRPGDEGLTMKLPTWQTMLKLSYELLDCVVPGFRMMVPCYMGIHSSSRLDMYNCNECNLCYWEDSDWE